MRRTLHPQRAELTTPLAPAQVFAALEDLRLLTRWWCVTLDEQPVRAGERVVRPLSGDALLAAPGVVVEVSEGASYARLGGKERLLAPAAVTRLTCTSVAPGERLRLEHESVDPPRRSGPVYTEVVIEGSAGADTVIRLEQGVEISGGGLWALGGRLAQRHQRASTATARRKLTQLERVARGVDEQG